MPWQRLVADTACELNPETGRPAYREVVVTVPRQQGKTLLYLVWMLHRCLSPRWEQPQRSLFTAQSGKDARDKWLDELFPLLEHSDIAPLIQRINRGIGNESVLFKTGAIIRLGSTSESSGHSKSLHQAVLDEIWHDVDHRREQALRPAMVTNADAQALVCSTAGTQASTVYNQKVAAGRQAVQEHAESGLAYFEWSAPDEWDPDDEDSYWGFMPALGHTIDLDVIRSERLALDDAEFRRAYGNRPSGAVNTIIPPEVWQRACHPTAKPDEQGLRFGLDVAEDRSSAAIAASDGEDVELVEHRQGVGWVVDRCNELLARWGGVVALDFGGPAGVLADQLDVVDRLKGREVAQACGQFFDRVAERRVRVRSDQALDTAVEGAVKKAVGDLWVWSRKASSADVTPLMATTLAAVAQPEESDELSGPVVF